MGEETKRIENPCDENICAALPPLQDGDGMFSPHVDLAQEYARKRLIHDEIDMC